MVNINSKKVMCVTEKGGVRPPRPPPFNPPLDITQEKNHSGSNLIQYDAEIRNVFNFDKAYFLN